MSGVYIKGVEIPAEGVLCIDIFPDGRVAGHYDCTIKQAKAVPVPDHGRLIDADAIMQHIRDNSRRAFGTDEVPEYSALSIVVDYFDAAPTIIPASKEI